MTETVTKVNASELGAVDNNARLVDAILKAWEPGLVVHVSGLDPAKADLAYYDSLVEALGTPHDLAEDATVRDREQQRIGRRWMEVRYDPAIPDAYRHSANGQPLHTDGSYISSFPAATLMFCVSAAPAGGETIFLPATDLVQILERDAPGLLDDLTTISLPHRRSGDEREEAVIRLGSAGDVLVNWNYYCVDPSAGGPVGTLAERFFLFLQSNPGVAEACRPVRLAPGEAVVWKDDRLLHGRNAFSATDPSERFIWKCAVDIGVWP